jgi:tripartite motif-containing protein 71
LQRSIIITIVILFFLTSTVKLVEGFSAERYLFVGKWGSICSFSTEDWSCTKEQAQSQFRYPTSIALDAGGNIFVTDSWNDRVLKFTRADNSTVEWGSRGSGDGEFHFPTGIAVDPSGNVYVADFGNSRVQKFTSDGKFITKWGSEGPGDGQFSRPQGVAVDPSGNVYVADSGNERIQKFTSDGRFITKWGSEGSSAAVGINTLYEGLSGIAVDKNKGIVYSTDTWNDSIQIFSPITELHS